jgi:predicted RecA/RadA family phage recombinase
MQATFIQEGHAIDHTPGGPVAAGQVVVQGSLIGVAKTPIEANRLGAIAVRGIFDVVKANEQISLGAAVYWDADGDPYGGTPSTGALTTSAGGNIFVGFTMAAAEATDPTVRVVWSGPLAVTNTVHNALTAAITDPGDAGAIPVTDSGTCPLVTTEVGGETRTLAAPTYAGQLLALAMKTDGGDCVVACATGLNQTGNNRATFNDAGDVLVLVGIEVGSNKRWRVVSNDGVTLATV